MLRLFVCVIILVSVVSAEVEIKISSGTIKGKHQKTFNGKRFSSFTGIPYAKPPVGEFRFKAPLPVDEWSGVYDATKPHPKCIQMNLYIRDYKISGDEDCLYLNVYTPQLTNYSTELLPVMVYIHGGGWMTGSAGLHGPNILLNRDVVLVIPNYRLGALGFLSTGDEVVPGNNGLKDQAFALKWTKENIQKFGGNPDSITVFGQSAGGASSHYHMLSPLSNNLIHKVIVQSGTSLATWSLFTKEEAINNARKLAQLMNCSYEDTNSMVDCLRKVDAYDIVNQDTEFLEWIYAPMIPFKPVIEMNLKGAFLTEDPIDIIKSGKAAKVPLMTGFTRDDGAVLTAYVWKDPKLIQELNKDFERVSPLLFLYNINSANKNLWKRIMEFYLGDRQIDNTTSSEVTNMITDGWFMLPTDAAVRMHKKYGQQPVYYYMFGYRGSFSYTRYYGNSTKDFGVCHSDELLYLFDSEIDLNNQHDKKVVDIMTTLWTNFAKTGNPTPELNNDVTTNWDPVTTNNLEYYHIHNDTHTVMDKQLFLKRAEFWRNLPVDARTIRIRDELL